MASSSLKIALKNFKQVREIKAEPLSPEQLQSALKLYQLDSTWEVVQEKSRNTLQRKFTFGHFIDSFGFMNACAIIADEMDHHPEWFNVFNRVNITLSTHDAGGISIKDILMAKSIVVFFESFK